ncbi:Hypothetical predicted protein [Lynx pardinus]|uniref:Uncharacterized protein n=1 Tax=Lynx pardinus TaxID=191816 RepID=A0A485MT10_LYNPA|nr:Hypothetical predicted protein [Lynx pardinus]
MWAVLSPVLSQCLQCPAGYFCPNQATQPIPCQPGTFSPNPGQDETTDCVPCPAAGHYCPLGTKRPTQFQCPPGTWSNQTGLTAVEECVPCPRGWGTSHQSLGARLAVACVLCPAGHHCPEPGTATPQPCGAGSFSGPGHLWCQKCSGGNLCNQTKLARPIACPPGHYCPAPGLLTIPCPMGTFREAPGAARVEDCQLCRPGAFCGRTGLTEPQGLCSPGHHCGPGSNTSSPEGLPFGDLCPAGHFCPAGTKDARQRPCPVGTWNAERGAQDVSWCLPCPPGFFCAAAGQAAPRGPCAPGWFCVSAAWTARPFDLDNYTSTNCLCPATATGGKCPAGSFCPEGSSEPMPCPPGSFCATSGYYCDSSAGPIKDFRLYPCPQGYYCPLGTAMATHHRCPVGTYGPRRGLRSIAECQLCPAGKFCALAGLAAPTGDCAAGHWCKGGATSKDPTDGARGLLCPAGHYCLEGTSPPLSLLQWWQGLRPQLCPRGFYCPEGTGLDWQPCPPGTYGPVQGLSSLPECQACDRGRFCPSANATEAGGQCWEGFFCSRGSTRPNPEADTEGTRPSLLDTDPLPHFLTPPNGRSLFSLSFSSEARLTVIDSAYLHPLSIGSGKPFPDGPCSAGYYCPPGQTSATPTSFRCPRGFYCPEGSPQPRACENGTFQPQEAKGSCEPCPAGFYCEASGTGLTAGGPSLCLQGYFCPPGSHSATAHPCPRGTFGPRRGASAELDCELCPAGMFCSSEGLSQPSGLCHSAHYCTGGAVSPTPLKHKNIDCPNPTLMPQRRDKVEAPGLSGNDICPPGFFCPRGTGSPMPCLPGSYSSAPGLASEDQCQPCPPGHYCSNPGLSHVPEAELCDAGYICLGGSAVPSPSDGTHGYRCPPGFHCPSGAHSEQPCEPGTFSPLPGADTCLPCPGGTYCQNVATVEPTTCPKGFQGAQKYFCIQGPCSAGYYCEGGASSPTPQRNSAFPLNGPCPRGHYCPQGTLYPVPCPMGTTRRSPGEHLTWSAWPVLCHQGEYQPSLGSDSCLLCPPGFHCPHPGTRMPRLCPAHAYCPAATLPSPGTWSPLPCPPGTFTPQDASGLREEGDCSVCPPGFYCPEGSGEPTLCPPHTMAAAPGAKQREEWDPATHPCPAGHYCPGGSETSPGTPQACPEHTYLPAEGGQSLAECLPCPPGYLCVSPGLSSLESRLCPPGYWCPGLALTARPRQGSPHFVLGAMPALLAPPPTLAQGSCTYRSLALDAQACQPCPPGFSCHQGEFGKPGCEQERGAGASSQNWAEPDMGPQYTTSPVP